MQETPEPQEDPRIAELRKQAANLHRATAAQLLTFYEGLADVSGGDPQRLHELSVALNVLGTREQIGGKAGLLRRAKQEGGKVSWSRRGELRVTIPKNANHQPPTPGNTPPQQANTHSEDTAPPSPPVRVHAPVLPPPPEPPIPAPPPAPPPPPPAPPPPPLPPSPPSSRRYGNVFDALLELGHDKDFAPRKGGENFVPTDASAGSREKVDVLAERVRLGLPLWHPEDRADNEGLSGLPRAHSNH